MVNHQHFWNYISNFQGEADVKDVFNKFAAENKLSIISSKMIWQNFIKDVTALFDDSVVSKYANITINPDGTIHIENAQSSGSDDDQPTESGISDNSADIAQSIQQQPTPMPQPSPAPVATQAPVQNQTQPQVQAPNSTIFNRL